MEVVEDLYVVAVVAVVVLSPYGRSVQVLHISLSSYHPLKSTYAFRVK